MVMNIDALKKQKQKTKTNKKSNKKHQDGFEERTLEKGKIGEVTPVV